MEHITVKLMTIQVNATSVTVVKPHRVLLHVQETERIATIPILILTYGTKLTNIATLVHHVWDL